MINNKLDMLIMAAMKEHDEARVRTLRAMKAKFTEWKTAKQNVGKPLTEEVELQIINKMVKERAESADLYEQGHRLDLAESEKVEIDILTTFLPKPATEDEMRVQFELLVCSGVEPVKPNMGKFVKAIKSEYPATDGKAVADFVLAHIS